MPAHAGPGTTVGSEPARNHWAGVLQTGATAGFSCLEGQVATRRLGQAGGATAARFFHRIAQDLIEAALIEIARIDQCGARQPEEAAQPNSAQGHSQEGSLQPTAIGTGGGGGMQRYPMHRNGNAHQAGQHDRQQQEQRPSVGQRNADQAARA